MSRRVLNRKDLKSLMHIFIQVYGMQNGRIQTLICRAGTQRTCSEVPLLQKVVRGSIALVAAGSLMAVPFPDAVEAVSGGGGISMPLSNEDFTGQDLTKNSYTKAVLRQTNFSNCELRLGYSL